MHRRAIRIMLASFLLATTASAATDDDRITGSVGIAAGFKNLDAGWEPQDDQVAVVVSLTIGKKKWPVHFALDYVSGEHRETRTTGFPVIPPFCCFMTEVTAKSETSELDLGVRRVWRQDKKFRPYAGGGIAFIDGEIRVDEAGLSADDSTTGYWLDAGFRKFKRRIGWGFDLRYSEGTINLGDGEVDAGGVQVLFNVGWRW